MTFVVLVMIHYNAKEFVERWAAENGPFGIEKVIQGARTESVPLGELKNYQKKECFCLTNH